jgi:hypothetical protein
MDILRIDTHGIRLGVSIYESGNSFGPLVRAYLRTADVDYLGVRGAGLGGLIFES